MPAVIMLVGVPYSGKSTYIERYLQGFPNHVVISTDKYVEAHARMVRKVYNEVFSEAIADANRAMQQELSEAVAARKNIIWDQTNVTAKTRMNKLKRIPADYCRIAIWFPHPTKDRIHSRPDKSVPKEALEDMMARFEIPTYQEGFHFVTSVA